MTLMQDLDAKQTQRKVDQFLRGHWQRTLRAGLGQQLPGSKPTGDARSIARRLGAQQQVKETLRVIDSLAPIYQVILKGLYLQREPLPRWQLLEQTGYGRTQYSKLKQKALLYFADGYMLEDLHVYNAKTDK
ncbi:phage protein [Agrilactobacillus composti DSM 18527 = JCM 14202]|nr:ArpU family phage packaging/lysis transcriptional regulator [Agrilactobacillus composti]GAF41769.1 phage protein [Agrilactobacillus composti DSM 18527 = JCM 14202]